MRHCFLTLCALILTVLALTPARAQLPPDPDSARALEMRIQDGFTIGAVGDLIISRPVMQQTDPAFKRLVQLLRQSDVTFGNFENTALELATFEGYPSAQYGGLRLRVPPRAVQDLKDMGFDMVSRANNHTTDWGVAGLLNTSEVLDAIGLVHAGAGKAMAAARAGAFLETPKGRVALVSMASSFGDDAPAMDPLGALPGRPGLSALRTTRYVLVTREEMEQLRQIRDAQPPRRLRGAEPEEEEEEEEEEEDELSLFGVRYRIGEQRGSTYEMNEQDLGEILAAIRQAKRSSDFVLATIHAHGPGNWSDVPPDFLEDLAHQAIDAGADKFVGHGPHQLRGIEIYKGKPIFYSLGNFFFQVELQTPLSVDIYRNSEVDPDLMTASELLRRWMDRSFEEPIWYRAVLAESRFERGQVAEIRLYPVELRHELAGANRGVPRMAQPEVAQEILQSLQFLSEPYGTEIRIENGIGIIRVPPTVTATGREQG